MKKSLIGALLIISTFAGASVASAQVYGSYGSYQNVYSYPGYTTSYGYGTQCPQFGTFYIGARGASVIALQQYLARIYPGQLVTGYFGPQTQGNWLRYQNSGCGTSYPSYPGYPTYDYDDDGEISLNYPEGDESFETGDEVNIEWSLEDEPRRSYVQIDLYDDRDRHVYTIKRVSSKEDDYEWDIPRRLEGDFYIQVTLKNEQGYEIDSDESDEFEIED